MSLDCTIEFNFWRLRRNGQTRSLKTLRIRLTKLSNKGTPSANSKKVWTNASYRIKAASSHNRCASETKPSFHLWPHFRSRRQQCSNLLEYLERLSLTSLRHRLSSKTKIDNNKIRVRHKWTLKAIWLFITIGLYQFIKISHRGLWTIHIAIRTLLGLVLGQSNPQSSRTRQLTP